MTFPFAHGGFQRQDDDPAPQTRQENCRPIRIISDLDRNDLPRVEVLQSVEAMAAFLDFPEAK